MSITAIAMMAISAMVVIVDLIVVYICTSLSIFALICALMNKV